MLMRRWERARQGDGQLVMIVGEPGLGKSRLIEEFHPRLREVPHTWVEWSCSQLLQNTPLYPIADWGRQRFGGADVPAEQRLADLENTLALIKLDPVENAPLTCAALGHSLTAGPCSWLCARGIATPATGGAYQLGGWPARELSRWCWRSKTCIGPIRPRSSFCAASPNAARWRHCLFLSPLGRSFGRPGACAHITARSRWRRLTVDQVRHMVGELAARHALPKEVVEGVTERTGGVPLFVEEVTRLLLERGEQGDIQAIPPTLQQSFMARLDRLGPAREVAQIAAVIGRDFSYPLLRAVAGMEDAPLQTALDRLAEADILLVQGYRQMPSIASSTRSFRMQLMRICSRADARLCIAASAIPCATSLPIPLQPSRNCWRIISLRQA